MSGLRLSEQAREALRLADALVERDRALCTLRELIDPAGRMPLWQLAGVLAKRLEHFRAAAWPRIHRGYREPHNALEAALAALCAADCPGSQKRLRVVLRALFE